MFGTIFLTIILLIGIPVGIYGALGFLYVWSQSRTSGCGSFFAIVIGFAGYLALWCWGVATVARWWIVLISTGVS